MSDRVETPTPPLRVFISYTHDSEDHKEWVLDLASYLKGEGFALVLDQWDIPLGGNIAHFMEQGLAKADRVLVICTGNYCAKANEGRGGAGYEKTIVTAELIRNSLSAKFIPVIREVLQGQDVYTPICLDGRMFIDLRKDSEELRKKLANELRRDLPTSPTAGLMAMQLAVESPSSVFDEALRLAEAKNVSQWGRYFRSTMNRVAKALVDSRPDLDRLGDEALMRKGLQAIAPLIAISLAGLESGDERFFVQEEAFEGLVNPAGWNRAGLRTIAELPTSLGFVFQYLVGAKAMQVKQLAVALRFARSSYAFPGYPDRYPICAFTPVTGWVKALRGELSRSWSFLLDFINHESWVAHCFTSREDAGTALAAYGYALTLDEAVACLRNELRSSGSWTPNPQTFSGIRPRVPLLFLILNEPAPTSGYQLFLRCQNDIPSIWEFHEVPRHLLPVGWEAWVRGTANWLAGMNYHQYQFAGAAASLPHALLMFDLAITRARPSYVDAR